jgi:hypothetical protein
MIATRTRCVGMTFVAIHRTVSSSLCDRDPRHGGRARDNVDPRQRGGILRRRITDGHLRHNGVPLSGCRVARVSTRYQYSPSIGKREKTIGIATAPAQYSGIFW